jgi:hypothetical protein
MRRLVLLLNSESPNDYMKKYTYDLTPILRGSGIQLINAEREDQIQNKGWTPEHDDSHEIGELREAAAAYLLLAEQGAELMHGQEAYRQAARRNAIDMWPWDVASFRPDSPRVECLVKAGALIAAEIDRINRQNDQTEPLQ